jgi:hypothetical protein
MALWREEKRWLIRRRGWQLKLTAAVYKKVCFGQRKRRAGTKLRRGTR